MNRFSSLSNAAKTLLPLVSLGAIAVIAGCGGGGQSSVPGPQSSQSNPSQSSRGTVRTMLTIAIPARGPKAVSIRRAPKYISPASAAIGVSVGPAGEAAPAQTVYTLPTPGPAPTTTTLPVTAPIGDDTVSVTIYDGVPSSTTNPSVLSQGTTTQTIGTGSTSLTVTALGVAAGVELTAGTATSFEVFQNHPSSQSTTLTATPVDADGYAISGTLATAVPLTAPAGVTLDPATVTVAGSTLTATYGASQTGPGGIVTAGLPLDTASGSTDNFTIAATQYLFVATSGVGAGSLSVIDPVAKKIVATIALGSQYPYAIAAVAGCASGETAVVAASTGGTTTGLTLSIPSSTTAPKTTDLTSTIAPRTGASVQQNEELSTSYLTSDADCSVYSANDANLTRYTGFPAAAGTAISSTGWTANSSIGNSAGVLYALTITDGGSVGATTETATVQSVASAGGAVTTYAASTATNEIVSDYGFESGGSDIYEINKLATGGGNTGLIAIPSGFTSNIPVPAGEVLNDFAVGLNGTVYFAFDTAGSGGRAYNLLGSRLGHGIGAGARGTTTTTRRSPDAEPSTPPEVSLTGEAVAASSDGRFVALGTSGAAPGSASVQLYTAGSGTTPTAIGTPIPLTGAQQTVVRAAFPR